jgi:hypothetical protein
MRALLLVAAAAVRSESMVFTVKVVVWAGGGYRRDSGCQVVAIVALNAGSSHF